MHDALGEAHAAAFVGDIRFDGRQAEAVRDVELAATTTADDDHRTALLHARRKGEADARGAAGDQDGAVGVVDRVWRGHGCSVVNGAQAPVISRLTDMSRSCNAVSSASLFVRFALLLS